MIQNMPQQEKKAKIIVKEDGTLDLTDLQVTDTTVFEITAVGYKNNLTFTYKEAENTFELNTSSKTLYTKGSTKTTTQSYNKPYR